MHYWTGHTKSYAFALLLAMLSGTLLSLGWPPAASFPLLFVAFVPLLYLVERLPLNKRGGIMCGVSAGLTLLVWNAYTTWWIYNTYFLSGVVISCINITVFSIPWLLYYVSRNRLPQWQRYVLLISTWMSLELMHYYWGLAFPYLNLGHGLAAVPAVAQWYEYTGMFGGSLWIWVSNVLLYEWVEEVVTKRVSRKGLSGPGTYALLWILLPMGGSLLQFATHQERGRSVEVVAVHPDLNCRKERKTYSTAALLKVHWDLTRPYLRDSTRYVLWPENCLNLGWLEELSVNPQVLALRDSLRNYPEAQLITGAILHERYQPRDPDEIPVNVRDMEVDGQKVWYNTYNAALQLNAGADVQMRTKIHLVPLEETTVYPALINLVRKFIPSLGGMSFSTRRFNQHLFRSPEIVSPLICYESLFGNTVRKFVDQEAGLLFVILNEGWIDNDQQARQFMQYASLRAIENRRSIVRSSNKGITCFIDQKGVITQAVIDNAATALTGKVQVNRKKTFYTMTGDYIGWVSVFVSASCLLRAMVAWMKVGLRNDVENKLLKRAA